MMCFFSLSSLCTSLFRVCIDALVAPPGFLFVAVDICFLHSFFNEVSLIATERAFSWLLLQRTLAEDGENKLAKITFSFAVLFSGFWQWAWSTPKVLIMIFNNAIGRKGGTSDIFHKFHDYVCLNLPLPSLQEACSWPWSLSMQTIFSVVLQLHLTLGRDISPAKPIKRTYNWARCCWESILGFALHANDDLLWGNGPDNASGPHFSCNPSSLMCFSLQPLVFWCFPKQLHELRWGSGP